MKIRILSLLVASMLLLSTMSMGCSSTGGSSSTKNVGSANTQPKNSTITFCYWDEGQKSGMDAMVELFENKHPNIKVESTVIPWGQYWTKLQTSLPSGTGPDVMWMNLYAPDYVKAGLLYDITDKVKEGGVDMTKFPKTVTNIYTFDGKLYGIPKDFDSIGMWYNKSIFKSMGVDTPKPDWTWDDFLSIAKKLTNKDHYGYVMTSEGNQGTNNFIFQNGGRIVTDDRKACLINQPANIEAVQFMHDLMYKYKVSPTGAEQSEMGMNDMFISGKAAMVSGGSWEVKPYYDALGSNLGVTELPKNKEKGTTTHGVALAIAAKSPNVDAAWEFLKFSATKEAQQATAQVVIPAYEGASDEWVKNYPSLDLKVFVDALSYSHDNGVYLKEESEATQIYSDAISTIWMQEKVDIKGILDNAQGKIQKLIQ